MIPIITAHAPAGTSTHTVIHYMQEYVSSKSSHIDVMFFD